MQNWGVSADRPPRGPIAERVCMFRLRIGKYTAVAGPTAAPARAVVESLERRASFAPPAVAGGPSTWAADTFTAGPSLVIHRTAGATTTIATAKPTVTVRTAPGSTPLLGG